MTKKIKFGILCLIILFVSAICFGGIFIFKSYADDKVGYVPLPTHFIKNATYSIEGKGYDGFISFDDSTEFTKIDDLSKVDLTGANEKVNLKFSNGSDESEVYSIPVVDVGFNDAYGLVIENYFQATKGVFNNEVSEDDVVYSTSSVDNELAFINYLSLSNFNFDFRVDGNFNANGLEFTFTDYYDRENTQKLSFYKEGVLTFLSNGKENIVVGSESKLPDYAMKNLSFSSVKNAFVFEDRFEMPLSNEFSSDRVLFSVSFKQLTGECGLRIEKVNNTDLRFNGIFDEELLRRIDGTDSSNPQVALIKNDGVKELNQTVTINKPDFCDVLSPILDEDVDFYVLAPDNSYAVSVDGVTLDGSQNLNTNYEIKLSMTGTYTVICSVSDSGSENRNGSDSFTIISTDLIAPNLTLANDYNQETTLNAKVGDEITVANYVCTDNYYSGDDLSVRIFVFEPDYCQKIFEKDQKTYTLAKKGTHKIYYMAIDGAGNYTTCYYNVVVE